MPVFFVFVSAGSPIRTFGDDDLKLNSHSREGGNPAGDNTGFRENYGILPLRQAQGQNDINLIEETS